MSESIADFSPRRLSWILGSWSMILWWRILYKGGIFLDVGLLQFHAAIRPSIIVTYSYITILNTRADKVWHFNGFRPVHIKNTHNKGCSIRMYVSENTEKIFTKSGIALGVQRFPFHIALFQYNSYFHDRFYHQFSSNRSSYVPKAVT